MAHPNTPVIIGVGDIINRNLAPHQAAEPLELMQNAIDIALHDTGLSEPSLSTLKSQTDSLDVVRTWTWPYPDLPTLLASRVGIQPKHKYYSPHGGNQPAKLVHEAARRIARGETTVAVITGGEALASLASCAKAGQLPPPGWTPVSEDVTTIFSPTTADVNSGLGKPHGIGAPIQVYPLFENGLRAHRGQSIRDNNDESGKLYAEFSQVAKRNPLAWGFVKPAETEESTKTVSSKNRMICYPYPLLMNAFNTINLAGAVILTSVSFAESLSIPSSKYIHLLGGAGTSDHADFWQRPNFYSSPAMSRSIDSALQVSGVVKDDIDLFDFYSCFPIVPKIACLHLGLPTTGQAKPITLLGGLTSFGGAGNNYSMHAITEMTRQLRNGKGKTGLVLANGGVMTYQHVLILSSSPRKDQLPYPDKNPLPEILEHDSVPQINKAPEGEAVIETYTIDFNRENEPELGHIIGRLLSTNHRFIANHGDRATLKHLSSGKEEMIGKSGYVKQDTAKKGRNLFSFSENARL